MKYCILNVWYLKPETKDGPPRLNFWNEVGKGKLEPKIVPMELEKDIWYRVVVKQIQSKSGKYNLRTGYRYESYHMTILDFTMASDIEKKIEMKVW